MMLTTMNSQSRINALEEFARYAAKYPLAADIREKANAVLAETKKLTMVEIAAESHVPQDGGYDIEDYTYEGG
jgi:hypothetical protein